MVVDFQTTDFQNKSSPLRLFHQFLEAALKGICSGIGHYPARGHIQGYAAYRHSTSALLACGHNIAQPWTV